jgi:hypothetical protein
MSETKQPRNGSHVSQGYTRRSNNELDAPPAKLQKLLATSYDRLQRVPGKARNEACRRDFVFHMTDWLADLDRITELYHHPEKFDKDEASRLVAGFLYHVIPHLKAAGRLLLDYTPKDFFKAVDGKPEPKKAMSRRAKR